MSDWQKCIPLIETFNHKSFSCGRFRSGLHLMPQFLLITPGDEKLRPDLCPPNPHTHRIDVKPYRMPYRGITAHHLKSTEGQRDVNMMRACDCSWLPASRMVITRLHRLPSEWAYQGVQLFPSAIATGNGGWGTFGGGSTRYQPLNYSSHPHGASGALGMKCRGQGPHWKHLRSGRKITCNTGRILCFIPDRSGTQGRRCLSLWLGVVFLKI